MIKYLVMDVDGSLTDGKIYMGPEGEAMKAFSIKDGYVINYILKPMNIVPIVITARTSSIVKNRCDELGIKEVYQGKLDKIKALNEIIGEEHIGECAYFGDDIIDLKCMNPIKEAGGIVGCPSDAVQEVKVKADYVCINKGGEGALREFSEWLVTPRTSFKDIEDRVNFAEDYLRSLDIKDIPIGEKQIVNDYFFYSIQSYETKPIDQCKLESHRKYIDIQIVVEGKELISVVDTSRLTVKEAYDDAKDVVYWNVPEHMLNIKLSAGDCVVLYPENAHMGATSFKEKNNVLKIVGKVRVS